MLFSPYHGYPEQARLMSDLGITIKAEGQSIILSKWCITSKYYNRGDLTGSINAKDPSC